MKNVMLELPTFAFVVSTRAALGLGIGLLVAERLPTERRRALGAAMVAIGAATTIPAALAVLRGVRRFRPRPGNVIGRDKHLIGATRFPRRGDDDSV
jgi:hypothetical protein